MAESHTKIKKKVRFKKGKMRGRLLQVLWIGYALNMSSDSSFRPSSYKRVTRHELDRCKRTERSFSSSLPPFNGKSGWAILAFLGEERRRGGVRNFGVALLLNACGPFPSRRGCFEGVQTRGNPCETRSTDECPRFLDSIWPGGTIISDSQEHVDWMVLGL